MQQQQQFLGRAALRPVDRLLATQAHALAAMEIDEETVAAHLRRGGFPPEEALEAARDPVGHANRAIAAVATAPELTRTLAQAGAPAHLVQGVRRFGDAVGRLDQAVLLDRCAVDGGGRRFEVAYYIPGSGIDVSQGDLFHGGFLLSGDGRDGTMTVVPRLVRQVCLNGLTQVTDQASDACTFRIDGEGRSYGELDPVLALGIARENVHTVVERMRQLQRKRAEDAVAALEREGARVPAWAHARVRAVFAANQDPTAYGALNALTQTARDAATIAERACLEVAAGQLAPAWVRTPSEAPYAR